MTALHRLMVSGRSALRWYRDQAISGTEDLDLQHLYRAMGWLGEALPSPRRNLFTNLVFFDATSLFFTGQGGDMPGQFGKSHRVTAGRWCW